MPERSRRHLVRDGLALGGAVVAASAAPLLVGTSRAIAEADGDAEVLRATIGLEQAAAYAYAAAATEGRLGRATPVARLFARQEQEHADGLSGALAGLGGNPPARPRRASDVPGLERAIAGSATEFLNFAVELETEAVAAYYSATAKLKSRELLSTGASIMACEAQHLVVLRQALGKNPSPDAFVTGRKG